jgi:hypothetical protein
MVMELVRKSTDKAIDAWLANSTKPKAGYSKLGFKLLKKDPILEGARKAGFKVVEYDLPPYNVRGLAGVANELLAFMILSTIACYILYHGVSHRSALLKQACVGAMISALIAWPLITGQSGIMLLDFWKPALGFRSCLLVWDIFNIRTRPEVNGWSFARFFCHLWAFPKEEEEIEERAKEEGFKRSAIVENAKGLPKVALEGVLMLMTLYLIPPYELTKNMSQFAYHCYCDMLGFCILMALALFGDGLLKLIGIVCNVEMADMFENPLGTVNIRLFWSHWNRAIATVLHRVIFGGGRNTKSSVKNQKKNKALAMQKRALANNGGAKRVHLDHLSETEAEASKTDDEDDSKRRARQNGLTMTSSASAGKANGSANGGGKSGSEKPKSPFYPKAIAAIATFAMSGIFHEWITAMTLHYASGENFVFFVLNGVATVVSTWFRRTYPELNAKIPTLVSVLMLHAFFLAVIPLFCAPFIQRGFFMQMEGLKYELLPWQAKKRGSFIYLFGQ